MTLRKTRALAATMVAPFLLSTVVAAPVAASDAVAVSSNVEIATFSNSGDQDTGRWVRYDLEVPYDATIDVTAVWDASTGNVNTFLYDDSNDLVAFANGVDDAPESFTYDATAGDYDLAVLVKTGSADYTVDVNATPPAPLDVFESSGDQDAGRWQTFRFTLDEPAPVTIIGDWIGGGNVNLFLRQMDGTTLAYANHKRRKPETLSYQAPAGTYEVAALVKRGKASYRLEVYDSPYAPATLSQSPPPIDTTVDEPVFEPAYPGQPAPGSLMWGASVGGNDDPVARHETSAGTSMPLRRTFFQWRHRTGYMINTARDDIQAGRLPWVSTKTPPWAEMARGDHDAQIDEMLEALDALPGPVWLTIHHEPEGGGGVNRPDDPAGPAGHLAMNRRVRERMTALGTDNVALAQVLMSYTWDDRSGRNPDEWWEEGVYDIAGVDHYTFSEASLVDSVWKEIRTWAAARGTDLAVGEWGMRGTDGAAGSRVLEWYDAAANSHVDGDGARVVGLAAFDSGLNSPHGSWELKGEQLRMFQQLMGDRRSARIDVP